MVLGSVWGYRGFRPGQAEAIAALREGRDVQVLLPTGGGKSLCYQVPAILAHRERGPTLVVSPLVALMEDQVASLTELGVPAACLHRGMPSDQRRLIEARLRDYALIYASPERLASARFRQRLRAAGIALVAVDEAHCISEWGHDFRKDYRTLGVLKDELAVPTMALTATATTTVMGDIARSLQLDEPVRVVGGFERPNLAFEVEHHRGDTARTERLAELLQEVDLKAGRAIVYAATRKRVVAVAKALRAHGLKVGHYHAGRTAGARASAQEAFGSGRTRVLVATTAFGMGVDLPDIRMVAHVQSPGSLEAYYQQAGRAGRDGEPARAVLLYAPGDAVTQARLRRGASSPGAEAGWKGLQDYAFATTCRQAKMVAWFTGTEGAACGRCDACRAPQATEAQVADARADHRQRQAATRAKRAADRATQLDDAQLEAVVAFVDGLRKPLGKTLVAEGLRGSQAKRVKRARVGSNPQFGALKGIPAVAIVAAIDDLLADGRLVKKGRKYPTLWVPDKRVRAKRDPSRPRSPKHTGLAGALRRFRSREARRKRWKPYQVFPDATLQAIVEQRPTTVKELMELPGIGPTRVRRYSQAMLELVREHPEG